jgi:hypothetical protein
MVDIIAVAAITIGFALYFFPTDEDGLMGWKRVIPVVLIAVYWISRGRLFRWLDRGLAQKDRTDQEEGRKNP